MSEFFINTLTHPAFGAVTFLLGILLGDHFAVSRDRRKEFNEAARTFKNNIRSELEGIYQAKSSWGKAAVPVIKEKTVKIRRYADGFSDSLKGSLKRDFNAATKAYCDYCDSITYEMCEQLNMFPESCPMPLEVKNARLNFDKHVDLLLSFAQEK